MAQSGFTPVQLYRSTTAAAVPLAANLAAGELAINLTDEKLYFENASGVVKVLADSTYVGTVTSVAASGGTTGLTFSGSPITSSGTLTLSGTLAVANGGTGATTLTGVVKGNGTSAFTAGTVSLTSEVSGTLPVANGGTGVTTSTGTVAVVLSNSPTLVTPNLGTPSAVTLTNATGLPLTTGVTGTLAVANGGTGVTTSTGTTSVVLSNSPVLVTPTLGAASATSIANGLGAVGTPSYTFTGDLNTGMWSPSADAVAFSTAGSERMRLDSSGNVGIGTSLPAARLQLAGTVVGATLRLENQTATTGKTYDIISGDGGPLRFQDVTAGAERMRIDSSGNVGIGTSAPGAKLDVNGTVWARADAAALGIDVIGRSADNGGQIRFLNNAASAALGTLASYGNDLALLNNTASFSLLFGTNSAERMRIDASGNVGIGTSAPGFKLQVGSASGGNEVAYFVNTSAGSTLAGVTVSIESGGNNTNSFHFAGVTQTVALWYLYGNGTTSYTSDIRVKKNVTTTRDGYLEDVCKLRVVKYNWYNDSDDTPRELGFIAQEVEQVFPGLVQDALHPTKDGEIHKVLKGSVMMPIMLKALQEASAKIDALTARVAQLEGN